MRKILNTSIIFSLLLMLILLGLFMFADREIDEIWAEQ